LNNKSISKLYSVYDQLSTNQGLNEGDAKDFLEEGLSVINRILPTVKLPKLAKETTNNNYKNIDTLVYTNNLNLSERVNAKKEIIQILKSEKESLKESIKLPVSSMVKIANQTLENYITNMDEDSKKVFMNVVKTDSKNLKEDYQNLKESTIDKLKTILTNESEQELKSKIQETIEKIQTQDFNQMNYVKLVSLEKNL
jgi:cell division GTPase FtsZ